MSQETHHLSYDTNRQIRTAVNRLTDLLEWLYPEPSPDIFTVRDYRNRYPFTRLGPLATSDIDRYQRVNRAIGNHVQMGLCEFHVGLIYMHEGAFRGAVTQFDQARQQWLFVNQSAAVALTFLARAVALQQAGHYESAMVSVSKVADWLDRSRLARPMLGWQAFQAQVLAYVAELQAALRQQMETAPQTETAVEEQAPDEAETLVEEEANEQQTRTIEPDLEAETQPDGAIDTAADTPMPISNMGYAASSILPIPGHRLVTERYEWYFVEVRPSSDFMPEINTGDWLLVDLQPDLTEDVQDTEQPILVVMDRKIDGTIRVRPLEPKERFQRIYLVTLADSPTGSFWRDEATGTVTFSSEMTEIGVNRTEILGVVVGFWRPMIIDQERAAQERE